MRALRSRTVQSDSENNEHVTEDSEQVAEEKISKKNKRKKSKKHTSDSEDTEHIQDLKRISEEFTSKKVERKKSKKHTSDSESNEHVMENSQHTTEATISKKLKRKKLKKHTSDSESNEHVMENSEHTTKATISKKLKRKKSKKHTSDSESNEHVMEDSEHPAEPTISKKLKRKKSKKHASNSESNEHMIEDSEPEPNISKKLKRKKSKKHASDDNDPDKVSEESVSKKKKCKKSKKETSNVVDNSSVNIQITEVVSNNSTEFEQETENSNEKIMKKKCRKPREFLRSTILKSPNFDNVITSTVMKPKRPEFEDIENDNIIENKSLNKINKLRKSKSELKIKRESNIEGNKEDLNTVSNRRETFKITPIRKVLNKTNDSILQSKTKRNSVSMSNLSNAMFDETEKCFEKNSPNKVKNQENIRGRTLGENTINHNRESMSKGRKSLKKTPISNGTIIAISDSPEISKIKENTFNKSNVTEPEITSDEEMETDDSLEQKSTKIEDNKRMLEPNERETFNRLSRNKIRHVVENTIITISDTPEKTTLKRNTFNKSDTLQPELTSDEDDEISYCEMRKITNKTNDYSKSKILDQSLDSTKSKESLVTQNDTTFSRRGTFCKTPINKSLRNSDKLFSETNNLSKPENNKEYKGLSDVSESILDVIDISDSTKINQSTLNLSNNVDNCTITKSDSKTVKSNGTFEIKLVNTSGNWQIEKSQDNENIDKQLNGTFNVENKENDSQSSNGNTTITANGSNNTTLKNEHMSLSPKDKSIRKKWLKFSRNSTDAQTVLDQISSPSLKNKMNASKIVQKIMNTPSDLCKLQKQIAPSNLSVQKNSVKKSPKSIKKSPFKSMKKSIITETSAKKSATKRKAMPNFALIHQKAYAKMENLAEYSERKKERAQMLLSSNNPGSKIKSASKSKEKIEEPKSKSSRQLFNNDTNDTKYNRFGFKTADPTNKPTICFVAKPQTHAAIVKPVVKPSVFARTEVVAIANKNKAVTNNRENRRDMMKGVRTNRRFELLMKMRNK